MTGPWSDGDLILKEIEARRARQFRDEYDFMPDSETAEQHRNRFKWLHREGALSEEELGQRLAMVDAVVFQRRHEIGLEHGARLN